ncbi:hypothetical protein JL721_3932 [Aureococcus anophagefferens]|nr:hypothetical protein JL721_3932 [Aureococcus anophagefferens]
MRLATRVAMIMAAALAISGVASTQAVGPAISGVATTNTSWWRLALAAPAISPDFALLSKHVCKREPIYMYERFWPYFPTDCVRKVDRPDSGLDGLGHVGHRIVGLIADRHGPGPAPHYFQEYVGEGAAYLRDVDGLGDGFAPSLYCHERDWLHAHGNPSQDEIAARWPAGDALFRGHFECFLTPPLDEWFGFDAFPPATDAARKRRAAAEAHGRRPRRLVDCGAPTASPRRRPPRRPLILSDSPPETVAATLEGLDVRIHVGGARRDDASRLVDGRTAGLENDFDLFDETMVLLATRLGVPLGDVLSVSAKNSSVAGARDPKTGDAVVHADASQIARVREWAEKTGFEARVAADYALWRNASARVRRDVRPLERELAEYRRLKRAVADPCAADPRNFEKDQCLWRDNGCAQPCIDAGLARDAG